MQELRTSRLANEFRQEIALIIHQELKDPRLGFVTITRVELSKDLRHAKVSYSCLGGREERERSQAALDHAAGFIYGLIKKRFRLKAIPELVFRYDESIEGALGLNQLLDRIGEEPAPPGRGEGGKER